MKRAIYDFLMFGSIFFVGLGISKGFSGGLVWISLLVGVVYAGVGWFWRWIRRRGRS